LLYPLPQLVINIHNVVFTNTQTAKQECRLRALSCLGKYVKDIVTKINPSVISPDVAQPSAAVKAPQGANSSADDEWAQGVWSSTIEPHHIPG